MKDPIRRSPGMRRRTRRATLLAALLASLAFVRPVLGGPNGGSELSALNPLPPAGRPIPLGYFHADGRYGDYFDEVSCYTNLYVGGCEALPSNPARCASVERAIAAGQSLYLSLNLPGEAVFDDAAVEAQAFAVLTSHAPYWASVRFLELADEPSWATAPEIDQRIAVVERVLASLGLARRPMGLVLTAEVSESLPPAPAGNRITRSRLDWVGIEAYVRPDTQSPDTCVNRATLHDRVTKSKAATLGKDAIFVMMSYDRNGCWTNLPSLVDLQMETYLLAHNDASVLGITMFSYGRQGAFPSCTCGTTCGGAHLHHELVPAHKAIAERLAGPLAPGCVEPAPAFSPCAPEVYPLGPPGSLRAKPVPGLPGAIDLSWEDRSLAEVGFGVERRAPGGLWSGIASRPPNTTTHRDFPPTGAVVTYEYRVRAQGGLVDSGFSNVASLTLPTHRGPRGDFDGDGNADLLFRHATLGDLSVWNLSTGTRVGSSVFSPSQPAATNWTLVGSNDFDGDGDPDLLWQNVTSGNLSIWWMEGTRRVSGTAFAGKGDPLWRVAGTGDFDGDGKPDLLFRHASSGDLALWLMNGAVPAGELLPSPPTVGPGTELSAVGDLDGDGDPDLVVRSLSDASLSYWLMDGAVRVAVGAFANAGAPDLGWRVVDLLDADRDGDLDLLFQNTTSNRVVIWTLQGTTKVGGAYLAPDAGADAGWTAIGPR